MPDGPGPPHPMLRWLGNTLATSVGRKIVMGLTGLLLVGFLVEHLIGNLELFRDEDGAAFDGYVEFLQGFGPLLTVAEIGLALLFLCHIYLGLRLTLENRQARKERYAVRADRGAKTAASASMHVTGALLLGYLIKHLLDFRFDGDFLDGPAQSVKETLSQPGHALFYLGAVVVLGMHLRHGFRSAFQSIGASHPKLDPLLEKAAVAIAILFALGFAAFPIYFLFFWSGGNG